MSAGTLLVLGAGEDQANAYIEARRRGLTTIGVDMRGDAPSVGLADRFLLMTTRDADGIERNVRGEDLVGVIAPAGDAATPTARELALRLGLPVTASATAATCSVDKTVFRAVVEDLGVPAYRSTTSDDTEVLMDSARRLDGRVVVKPADSSGSKGVAVVHGHEVEQAIEAARVVSVSGQIMVEEYVDGRPLAVEAFMSGGRPEICLVAERTTTGPPHMITTAHIAPARMAPEQQQALRQLVADVAARIEHLDGPLNLDLVLAPDGVPWLIEMGARLGGNGMPQLVRLVHGVDTVAAAVDHACGMPFDVVPRCSRSAATCILYTERGGVLTALLNVDGFARSACVVDYELFVSPGDVVQPYTRAANKLGYVLLSDDDEDRLYRTVDEIRQGFAVSLEGDDEKHRRIGATW